jgi:uncharacterized protein
MSIPSELALPGIGAVSFVLGFAGATVGLVLGHLRLPLLIAYLGSPVAGASTNLAVSGLGALAGTVQHARGGRVSWSALLLMGVPSAVGAVIGVLLFVKVDRFLAYLALGVVLILMGWRMTRIKPEPAGEQEQTNRGEMPRGFRLVREIGIGVLLGVLASVTGLMMNSLRLPVLIRTLKIDPRVAVGSNMAIGFFTALIGAATALAAGAGFDLLSLAVVGPPTMLGSYLGAQLTGKLRKDAVKRLLGWAILLTGLLMVGQACWKQTRPRELQGPPETPAQEKELEDEDDEWPDLDWFEETLVSPEEKGSQIA